MPSITLRDAGIATPVPLFRDLSLIIADGDRVGLVAGNGGGKSTLLRAVAGTGELTHGEIVRSRGLRLGFVEQDVPASLLTLPLAEAVRRALPAAERDSQSWRVEMVLDAFAAPAELRDRPLAALSGGWQRLALIARAAVTEPDALLLDEPTNHLDLEKIALLETWITEACARMAMLIASHDRAFLDATTNRTIFLRPETSRIYAHPFSRARKLLDDDDAAAAEKLTRDSREADRLRRSAGALRNIGINSRSDHAQRKSMLMANRAETLERTLQVPHRERSGEIRLANRGTHARVMLTLDDVPVSTPDGRVLFRTGKFTLMQKDRLLILGANGVGKSRLVAVLRRATLDREPVPGVHVAASLVPGYVDQLMSHLPDAATPHAVLSRAHDLGDQRCLSLLAGAGIAVDRQRRPVAELSPGQKARLGLLMLRLAEPNFYLMDEPTNHIDIAGQERLEAEILAHEATCVLVSHDRGFVGAIATRRVLVEAGRMREVP